MSYQIIVMGVSGCGKSTVGKVLAKRLAYPFHDGDDYHPQANIDKMRQGHPLTDADRAVWLQTLHDSVLCQNDGVVLACSALKPAYRNTLTAGLQQPLFVYLKGSFDDIWQRHQHRQGHYFQGQSMLKSQFDTLVEPTGDNVISVSVNLTIAQIVDSVCQRLPNITEHNNG